MAKKQRASASKSAAPDVALVAATLTGIVYQARLFNRQARMNVPESSVIAEVVDLWCSVSEALSRKRK